MIICPILGNWITSYLGLAWINWMGLYLIIWIRWIWELNQTLNTGLKEHLKLNLTWNNVSYVLLTAYYLLLIFGLSEIEIADGTGLNLLSIILPCCYIILTVYLLGTTSRLLTINFNNREPDVFESIGHIMLLIFFPLGIWTIHKLLNPKEQTSNKR